MGIEKNYIFGWCTTLRNYSFLFENLCLDFYEVSHQRFKWDIMIDGWINLMILWTIFSRKKERKKECIAILFCLCNWIIILNKFSGTSLYMDEQ